MSKYRLWSAVALFVAVLGAPSLAHPVLGGVKVTSPSGVSRTQVMRSARRYVSRHEGWAKEAVYSAKHFGVEWLVSVRPRSFHGLDGPERLLVISKRGQVTHCYPSD